MSRKIRIVSYPTPFACRRRGPGLSSLVTLEIGFTETRLKRIQLSVCAAERGSPRATGPVARADPNLTGRELSEAPVNAHPVVNAKAVTGVEREGACPSLRVLIQESPKVLAAQV
jgi:hypothetical protein